MKHAQFARTKAVLLGWFVVSLALPSSAWAVTTTEGSDGTDGSSGTPMLDVTTDRTFCSQSARGAVVNLPGGAVITLNACSTSTLSGLDTLPPPLWAGDVTTTNTASSTAIGTGLSSYVPLPNVTITGSGTATGTVTTTGTHNAIGWLGTTATGTATYTSIYYATMTASGLGTVTATVTVTGTGTVLLTSTNSSTATQYSTGVRMLVSTSTGVETNLGVGTTEPVAKTEIVADQPAFTALRVHGETSMVQNIASFWRGDGKQAFTIRPDGSLLIGGINCIGCIDNGAVLTYGRLELSGAGTYMQLGNGQLIADDGAGGLALTATRTTGHIQASALSLDILKGALVLGSAGYAGSATFKGLTSGSSQITVPDVAGTGTVFPLPDASPASGKFHKGTSGTATTWANIAEGDVTNLVTDLSGKMPLPSLTLNYLPRSTSSSTLVDSRLSDDGTSTLKAQGTGANTMILEDYSTTLGHANYYMFKRSHGSSVGSMATTQNGEGIGAFYFYGTGSTNLFSDAAEILASQSGAVSTAGHVPTRLELRTHSATATNANQFVLNPDGTSTFGFLLNVPSLTDTGIVTINPSGGGTGYLKLAISGTRKGILGFGGSIDGSTDANIDLFADAGEVQIWSAGTKAAWADTSQWWNTAKGLKLNGSSSGVVTVQPAAAAGTWSLTLPTTGGTSNYFLQTNGSGVTTWAGALTLNAVTCAAGSNTFAATNGQITACSTTAYLSGNAVTCTGKTKINATNGQITSCTDATYSDVGAMAAASLTTGTLPKAAGANSLTNSIVSESGTTLTVAGSIVPDASSTRDVGSSAKPLNRLYTNSLRLAGVDATSVPTANAPVVADGAGTVKAWVPGRIEYVSLVAGTGSSGIYTGSWTELGADTFATASTALIQIDANANFGIVSGSTEECGLRILLDGVQAGYVAWVYTPSTATDYGSVVNTIASVSAGTHTVTMQASAKGSSGQCAVNAGLGYNQMRIVEFSTP